MGKICGRMLGSPKLEYRFAVLREILGGPKSMADIVSSVGDITYLDVYNALSIMRRYGFVAHDEEGRYFVPESNRDLLALVYRIYDLLRGSTSREEFEACMGVMQNPAKLAIAYVIYISGSIDSGNLSEYVNKIMSYARKCRVLFRHLFFLGISIAPSSIRRYAYMMAASSPKILEKRDDKWVLTELGKKFMELVLAEIRRNVDRVRIPEVHPLSRIRGAIRTRERLQDMLDRIYSTLRSMRKDLEDVLEMMRDAQKLLPRGKIESLDSMRAFARDVDVKAASKIFADIARELDSICDRAQEIRAKSEILPKQFSWYLDVVLSNMRKVAEEIEGLMGCRREELIDHVSRLLDYYSNIRDLLSENAKREILEIIVTTVIRNVSAIEVMPRIMEYLSERGWSEESRILGETLARLLGKEQA